MTLADHTSSFRESLAAVLDAAKEDDMLWGENTTLRTVRENDLEQLYDFHQDIGSRGRYYHNGVMAAPVFKNYRRESGFWGEDQGMLVIEFEGDIVGHIESFGTVSCPDELELAYHFYTAESRGRGITTPALRLMTAYLFHRRKTDRIRLIIHPDNKASKRVAEKGGYRLESNARGAWYHRGKNQDVEVYVLLRGTYDRIRDA